MTILDSQVVTNIFREVHDPAGDVDVEGIVRVFRFNKEKLDKYAEAIRELLLELPDPFMRSSGGGWSFLNAAMDKHGNQWTGMHSTMEALFAMGMAIGLVENLLPRDAWKVLPGGVPYYAVLDDKELT